MGEVRDNTAKGYRYNSRSLAWHRGQKCITESPTGLYS